MSGHFFATVKVTTPSNLMDFEGGDSKSSNRHKCYNLPKPPQTAYNTAWRGESAHLRLSKDATMRALILSFVCLTLFFGHSFPVLGQETPAATDPAKAPGAEDPAKPAEPASPVAATPAGATEGPAAKPQGPREIYLPFKFLKGIFDSQGASVVVPLDEYKRLKEAAEKLHVAAPSVTAVITSANYVASIEQDLARIRAELTVNVLGTPWVEIPIRFGDAAVGKLEAGEKILLKGTGEGNYSLLFGNTGEQKVVIELTARVHTSPEGRDFGFDVPTTGITTFEIVIPEADQTVEVTPRLIGIPVEAAAMQTRIKANLGATPRISARWRPKATSKPEMDLLASVTNYTKVNIEDGLIHTDALLVYEVLRGEVSQLRVSVPQNHRILDVSAEARLKGWTSKEEEGRQIVTVDLLGGQTGKFNVEVHTERKIPDEAFDIAGSTETQSVGIQALDVVRESGQIGIFHSKDLTLTIEEQQGVVRIDGGELQEKLRGEDVTSFKYYSPKFALRASVKPVQPRVLVDQRTVLSFEEDELRLLSALYYTVERAGIFQLLIKVPEGLIIDAVECPALKEFNVNESSHQLTISLNDKTTGQIAIQIRGHRSYSTGTDQAELVLPVLEPVDVERDIGTIHVFAKESIEVVANDKGIVSAQPLPVGSGNAVTEVRGAVASSAWSYTRRPVTIPVKTARKPTRLQSTVATTVRLQPELTEVKTRLEFQVQYAGLDTFRFLVPESVSDRIQIETDSTQNGSPGIKQKSAAPAKDGWVEWTVVMQREVLGAQPFNISYDQKPDQTAGAKDRKIVVQVVRPLGHMKGDTQTPLSQVTGELAITKDDSLAVTAQATGGDVEPIDVRELTLLPQNGTQAFRYFTQPDDKAIQLELTQTKYEIKEVVASVVSKEIVEVVVGESSDATYLAKFRLKTSERQRLLAHMPKGLKVLSVTVADREVSLERADIASDQQLGNSWEAYWINVARDMGSDQEFVITLHFQWTVNPTLGDSTYGRGSLDLPLPVLGQKEAVPVQQLKTIIYVPDKFSLVGDPDGFVSAAPVRPWRAFWWGHRQPSKTDASWFGDSGSSERLPTQGRVAYDFSNLGGAKQITVTWWNRIGMAFLFSMAAAGIAFLLVKTSVDNKLSVLVVAVFAAVLYGLKDSQTLAHALLAARYGIFFLLSLWTVKSLFGRRAIAASALAAAPLMGAAAITPTAPSVTTTTDHTTAPATEPTAPDTPPPPPGHTDNDQPQV